MQKPISQLCLCIGFVRMAPAPARQGEDCDSKGKHPLYTGWYKNSTTDVEQIKKWWTKTPNANIGIPTGEKSGWLVLDVDDGGDETLSAFESTHGKLPDTVTAVTGGGGRALYL